MNRVLQKPEKIEVASTKTPWQQAAKVEERIPLLMPEEEKRVASFRSLKVHVECAETFIGLAQKSAKKTYPGHFRSMMEDISAAIDSAVNALNEDTGGIIEIDNFVGNAIAGIEQAREMGYANRRREGSWLELSRQIDSHIDSLRTAAQEIKAQRYAPQEQPTLSR